ncbi:GntR family transcriptional regulator, partial [Agrococcus casei]
MTLAATSKSQLAYEAVRESIQNGRFGPGQRLVLEAIGNELGVSVVPVREAIRRLEAEGLVTFERNVGARVARIDPREFFVTVEALSYVEGAAISLGAKLVTPEAISEARSINAQMREMATSDHLDAQEFSRLNERFHRILS